MPGIHALAPFSEEVVSYLDDVSRQLLSDPACRRYPDVVTFAFWVRRASTKHLEARFPAREGTLRLGRGIVFHIAPSNVPTNFAYSLAAGLLCGNANVVRVPSRDFLQVDMIAAALRKALEGHPDMAPRVALVRYGHDRSANDALSALCDVRVAWGGDATIAELRKSPLPPRSTEVTFADRWSLAVVDSDAYLTAQDRSGVAQGFYNDTYLSDQNACTSPRVVAWTGGGVEEAREAFWRELHELAAKRYELQPISAVDKLATACLAAARFPGARVEPTQDNVLVRVSVPTPCEGLMDLRGSCGLFYECEAQDVSALAGLLDDTRCQTVGYVGSPRPVLDLVATGIRGVDRVVPVGRTMDFDLLWDGYDLTASLTRSVRLVSDRSGESHEKAFGLPDGIDARGNEES